MPANPAFSLRWLSPSCNARGDPVMSCEKFRIRAEADQECHVLLPENARKERRSRPAFDFDQIALAARDVDEEANGQRQIRLAGEVFDGLRSAVFRQTEVSFFQVGDQGVLLVPDRTIEVDDIHVDLDWFADVVFHLLLQRC